MIDFIVQILSVPGDFFRNLMLAIPMSAAKGLFILYPLILLVVLFMQKSEDVKGKLHLLGDNVDIRPMAAIALIMQVIIYAVF